MNTNTSNSSQHFEGESALKHVVRKQSQGLLDSHEPHGGEMPDHLYALVDTAKELTILLLLLWNILSFTETSDFIWVTMPVLALSLLIWKTCSATWHSWSRLERLNRLLEQERWEIENNRHQERDELRALYAAKGFEGKLLEEVLDVLMADGNRLLQIMLEEEMGLQLASYEHPLKEGLGAFLGALSTLVLVLSGFYFGGVFGGVIISFLIIIGSAVTVAKYQQAPLVPAIIWNIGIASLSFGSSFFLLEHIL